MQIIKIRHLVSKSNIPSLILFFVFCCSTFFYKLLDKNYIFLFNVDFNSFFNPLSLILNILFITVLIIYFFVLGKYILNKFELNFPKSIAIGIGIVFFNIILLPLFFANLLHHLILILLFLFLSILLSTELKNLFKIRIIKIELKKCIFYKNLFSRLLSEINIRKIFHFYSTLVWLIIIIFAFISHFINAISPVHFRESLEDVANSYFDVYMNLAYFNGMKLIPHLAGSLSKFLNFEVIISCIIVLSNPETVKLFGFSIFVLLSIMICDFSKYVIKTDLRKLTLIIFLLCPIFLNDYLFSFAHDRVYFIFLSFLSFFLLFLGIEQKNAKYHNINFIIMGVLVGTNPSGMISTTINLIILLLFYNEWKKYIINLSPFFIVFIFISSVFPIWNCIHSGSFMPTNIFINKLFNINVNPDIFNLYLSERIGLQFRSIEKAHFLNYFLFPFRFIYRHYNILVFFFPIGFLYILKNRKLRIMYIYIILNIAVYLVLFENSVKLGTYARFHIVVLPILLISITQVMSNWNLKVDKYYFLLNIIMWIAIFMSLRECSNLKFNFKIKKDFITKKITLENYLEAFQHNSINKIKFFNSNFSRSDKILYFYHAQNIYIKPQLYQNTKPGVSILYTSKNQKAIMNKLQKVGINYLCVDNKWNISANNPFKAMAADITTPIFEPDFLAMHFIPIKTNISDLYLFKICYDGIKDIEKINANRESIEEIGFYNYIYIAIEKNIKNNSLVRIKSNPYFVETLLNKYKSFYSYHTTNKVKNELF